MVLCQWHVHASVAFIVIHVYKASSPEFNEVAPRCNGDAAGSHHEQHRATGPVRHEHLKSCFVSQDWYHCIAG